MRNVQSVLHSRRPPPGLTAAAAVLVAALVLGSLAAQAQADPFCTHTKLNIVAHQDDDLIFQNPALLEAIAAGDCVRTVFVTAGDAGLGEAYWREREEGSRAAYAVMAGVANSWTKSEATVAGHTLHIATLTGKPTVSQVYMRLPNGGANGTGYAATGFKSLPKLWRSHNPEPAGLTPITELSALDGSATYTYEGLLATLEALIAEFEPEVISTQDFIHEFGTGDHADHITVAKLTRIAANSWTTEHVLRSYMDYESKNFAVNVFEPQLAKKLSAYYAYAVHDSNEACASQLKCEEPFYTDYWAWLHRQIVLAETSVPGADAGPDQAVAGKASVTLDGSGSSDPLGHTLSYEWKQTAGPTVTLSNSHAVKPTFTAPTGPTSLVFSLLVKSSEASSKTDSVTVNVAAPKYTLKVTRSGNGSGTVTSSPAGIDCGSDCEEAYEQGTKVALTPAPSAGSEFKGWSGACTGTGTCEVTMSSAKSVGAEFALQRHQLTVSKSGTGSGTVTSTPAGIECGATCTASFDHGTEVMLSASPAAGSEFNGWSGACTGTGSCKVTMTSAKSIGAEFGPVPKYALKVSRSGNGSGTVTSSPAGIECGSDCEESYEQGTKVALTPSPAAGSEFKGWSGACSGAGTCEVTMSSAKSVGAEFALQRHQLTVSKAGTGSGTVTSTPAGIECGATCAASFDHGTLVKLTGTPATGSKAVVWSGCDAVNASNQCEVTMSAAKAVTATFSLESHQLTVAKNGSGTGGVTSSPAGINCGSECSASYPHGTLVKLTGAPGPNTKAVVWESCPGTVNASNQCEVTMSAAKEAKATFNLEQRQLTIEKKGSGSGNVTSAPAGINCGATCEAAFDHGTEVTLSASPAAGSEFKGWSGACTGSGACKVTMSAAKVVGAEFAPVPKYALKVTRAANGSGAVTSSPAGIECGSDCEESYEQGTKVTLTPSPASGSEFKGWSGACSGTGACEVTMSSAKSVGAEFALQRHQLTVSKAGTGSGTVTSTPAGIECGTTCEASFDHGTDVTLSATPGPNSKAVAWESCPGTVNASNQCEVTVDATKEAKARFDLESHQLMVNKTGSGTVTSAPAGIACGATCEAAFEHGSEVTLTAAPAVGFKAAGWSGCDAIVGSDECKVTMTAAKEVAAKFDPVGTFALKVIKTGNGAGVVAGSPTGIDCGPTCEAVFTEGTKVKLASVSATGSKAVEWFGCDTVAGGECEVTMSAAKEVTATYTLETRSLKIVKTGDGQGTVASSPAGIKCGLTCGAAFDYGTEVTLSVAPAGAETVVWSGCDEIVGGVCRISMDADGEVSARLNRVIVPPEQTSLPNPTPIPTPAPAPSMTPSIKLLKAKVEHSRGTARFVFAARGSATSFRCALASVRPKQKLKYKPCSSPMTYRNLAPGRYVFKVKAVGPGGTDTTPATRKFKVRAS